LVGSVCLLVGLVVGRRTGATNPPSVVSDIRTHADAGVATASVESHGGGDFASVTCRVEPPPPPRPVRLSCPKISDQPVVLECAEPPACPALVCEGTASTRTPSILAHADTPLLPPAIVQVSPRDSLRRWGIGPALGLTENLEVRLGLGAAWQPIPEIELHGNVVWTGQGKVPVAASTDVLFRF